MTTEKNDLDAALSVLSELAAKGSYETRATGSTGISEKITELLGHARASETNLFGYRIFTHRLGSQTRMNLFTQVADWDQSAIKSSTELLSTFGYVRDGSLKLNCTMRYQSPNTQGLYLDVSPDNELLLARSNNPNLPIVEVWSIPLLEERIYSKLAKSIRVEVQSQKFDGLESFRLVRAVSYEEPKVGTFADLVRLSAITIDHVCSGTPAGGCHEKGPLFKIDREQLHRAFSKVSRRLL